jgi:hypothetical protein
MDYNLELTKLKYEEKKLIQQAVKDGFKLVNGELIKKEYIPVIEVYARANTNYEAYGSFYFLKKIIPITNEQLNEIKKLKQDEDTLANNFVFNGTLSKIANLDSLYEILDWGNFNEKSITNIVEDLEEEYVLVDGQKLYLEFFFGSENMEGYISVFDMKSDSFENLQQENIEQYFHKYLTYN